jgi:hypothetical protein
LGYFVLVLVVLKSCVERVRLLNILFYGFNHTGTDVFRIFG